MNKRSSGILLHISSLPGDYGIGTFGADAYRFVDFLSAGRQSIWQILPLSPSGDSASPYMSPSAFAGNPLLLDLEALRSEGLLTDEELHAQRMDSPDRIDYDQLMQRRESAFRVAYSRLPQPPVIPAAQAHWLTDYALFMAAKRHFGDVAFFHWPDEALLRHEPAAIAHYTELLQEEIGYHVFLQLCFLRQWQALKTYANEKSIRIMGDLPIYLSPDSDAVWANPELFDLSANRQAQRVAGVPPDAFSDVGQHWGNPLYRWSIHSETGFAWWRRRIDHLATLYDLLRIDHFRAAHTYWSIAAEDEDARSGRWCKGPGMPFVQAISHSTLTLVAEDLGDLDEEAVSFIQDSGLPGMRVLVQAFDHPESTFLPHNCAGNCFLYTSTHDAPTFMEWYHQLAHDGTRDYARRYMNLTAEEGLNWGILRAAWSSAAATVIASFQDVLGLGGDARMNIPGTVGPHNWSWRVRRDAFNPSVSEPLRNLTELYSR